VLALAVLGTASTFTYRALFGGFPAPLPIIKVSTGSNKIAIEIGWNHSSQTSIASPAISETSLSREQQPVDIREVSKTVPRVISAIPVSSRPSDTRWSAPGSAAVALLVPLPADTAPAVDAPMTSGVDSDVAPSVPPPSSASIPMPGSSDRTESSESAALSRATDTAPAPEAPAASAVDSGVAAPVPPSASAPESIPDSSEPTNVQAVVVGPDGGVEADTVLRSALSRHRAARAAARSRGATPRVGIHDAHTDTTPSSSTRSHTPGASGIAGEASSGGYTVQLASERSAAAAHTSFRALRAKFPNQLGGSEPIVRRANLGVKGTYYRAMVGPFASMESAAGMCKTLKAAGGNCVIQRN
jgi:SPOR domain